MKLRKLWSSQPTVAAGVFAAVLLASPVPSQAQANSYDQPQLRSQTGLHLAQFRECSQRVGPFVTQTTAWQRWRNAQSQGYEVSNGVVPCYEGNTRGYCFFAFYRC